MPHTWITIYSEGIVAGLIRDTIFIIAWKQVINVRQAFYWSNKMISAVKQRIQFSFHHEGSVVSDSDSCQRCNAQPLERVIELRIFQRANVTAHSNSDLAHLCNTVFCQSVIPRTSRSRACYWILQSTLTQFTQADFLIVKFPSIIKLWP